MTFVLKNKGLKLNTQGEDKVKMPEEDSQLQANKRDLRVKPTLVTPLS